MWVAFIQFAILAVFLSLGLLLAISPRMYGELIHRHPRQRPYFDKAFNTPTGSRDLRTVGILLGAFAIFMTILLARSYMRK
jgi:hypothetical protein